MRLFQFENLIHRIMRMINAKYPITELNINNILKFFRIIYRNLPSIRFEIIETKSTFQFKFHIIKSNLSPVERYWLKSKIKKFIKYEDI
nr:MAG TPA: hypothetical protein [Caudoviricetes sp.]